MKTRTIDVSERLSQGSLSPGRHSRASWNPRELRHSGGSRNPLVSILSWMPALAGMTMAATLRGILAFVATFGLLLATGCTHSDPVRVEQDYGNSVRHMLNAQIYNPEAAEHPIIDPPRPLDGEKAEAVIRSYRSDVPKPETGALPPAVISIGD